MQQSRYLTPRQAAKSEKPYATVPLCHCVTASQCSPILFVVFFVVSELLFIFADRNQNVFLFLFVFFDYSE